MLVPTGRIEGEDCRGQEGQQEEKEEGQGISIVTPPLLSWLRLCEFTLPFFLLLLSWRCLYSIITSSRGFRFLSLSESPKSLLDENILPPYIAHHHDVYPDLSFRFRLCHTKTMESYPDPTLPSRQPGYPYFLNFVGTPESLRYQNDKFTPPQFSGPPQDLEAIFEDYVVCAQAYERPHRAFQQPFGTTEHGLGTSAGVAAAHVMPSPAFPLPRKRRRVASQDKQPKRQRLPVVGVFRPPQPLVPRARSPERAFRNTQNAIFTAKNQEISFRTVAKHKNTRGQIKSTIIYKEDRQGKLVIQKYSHQRNGRDVAVRDKPVHTHKVSRRSGTPSITAN